MKVVSMERTKAEKKAAQERIEAMPSPSDGPDYPWGLCLNLGADELAKLGIDDLPAVGDEMHFGGVAIVTRVSQSASQHGEESKGVELQITHLGVNDGDDDDGQGFVKAAAKFYPDKK